MSREVSGQVLQNKAIIIGDEVLNLLRYYFLSLRLPEKNILLIKGCTRNCGRRTRNCGDCRYLYAELRDMVYAELRADFRYSPGPVQN